MIRSKPIKPAVPIRDRVLLGMIVAAGLYVVSLCGLAAAADAKLPAPAPRADAGAGSAGDPTLAAAPTTLPSRWILGEGETTVWPVASDARLPHGDFLEQGGLRCGQVVD